MTLNVGLCITSMLCTEKLMSYPCPDDTLIHRMKQNVKSNDLLMSCELNRCSTYLAIADQADTSLGLCIRYATNFQPLIRIYIYTTTNSHVKFIGLYAYRGTTLVIVYRCNIASSIASSLHHDQLI